MTYVFFLISLKCVDWYLVSKFNPLASKELRNINRLKISCSLSVAMMVYGV